MFPDSEIAKGFASGRTKTTQIIKRAISSNLNNDVIQKCQAQKFTIMCDESNDYGDDKCFIILVHYFDNDLGQTVTRFLDMPVVNIGNAENLFMALDKTLIDRNIPWDNVLGFASDNCSVMKGKNNSVLSRIKDKVPSLVDIGCICHLANLCCGAAVKILPMPIEDLIIDIYYHFQHSAKRKEQYKEFLEFQDVEPLKILKHVSTRWLSLHKCVVRTLHHWPAILSYFKSHNDVEKEGRVKRTAHNLDNPEMKMYFLFLEYILLPLNEFNTAFQADAAKIGLLHEHMKRLLRKFLGKFVQSSIIASNEDVTKVAFDVPENQLSDQYIAIGLKNRTFLVENEDDIDSNMQHRLFRSVRKFYEVIVRKMIQKFPFTDQTLVDLGFVNPRMKHKLTSNCVVNLAKRFDGVIKEDDMEKLVEEFSDYQLAPEIELPKCDNDTDIENFWANMSNLKDIFGESRFCILSKLAVTALTLPNSNADCERAFSIVKKIHTEFRSELNNSTVCSLLACKFNQTTDNCYDYKPPADVLKTAKSAASDYNKSLQ